MPDTRFKLRLDRQHTLELLQGKPIAVKIPADTEVLEIHAPAVATVPHNSFAEQLDVFFNGRPAR